MAAVRSATVRAPAKINLSLKVLGKRADGFHELRTVFQTIGLADRISFEFTPGRGAAINLDDSLAIENNLVTRAAQMFFERYNVHGRLRMRLDKRIPMGGGLGGGSSDAATVLLTLGALTGKRVKLAGLMELASQLGSDVGFFLVGGTAMGVGRGEELFPLPDYGMRPLLILAPPLHVSTPDAYRALGRGALTSAVEFSRISTFQSFVWQAFESSDAENDFEDAVFRLHPELGRWRRKLERLGAQPARLSGSGAALYGVFPDRAKLQGALRQFHTEPLKVFSTTTMTRRAYRARLLASLRGNAIESTWPPRSWYER